MEVENPCISGLLLLPPLQLKGSPLAKRVEELPLLFRGIHDSQKVLGREAVMAAVDLSEDADLYPHRILGAVPSCPGAAKGSE